MTSPQIIFWVGTVLLLGSVLQASYSQFNPKWRHNKIVQSFEEPAWKTWLGIIQILVMGITLVFASFHAQFGIFWLILGFTWIVFATSAAPILFFLTRNVEVTDEDRLRYKLFNNPHTIAKRMMQNSLKKALISSFIFVLWILAWI